MLFSGYMIAYRTKGMPKRACAQFQKKQGHRVTLSNCNGPVLDFLIAR